MRIQIFFFVTLIFFFKFHDNNILLYKNNQTPDGLVKFDHWKSLVEYDESKHIKLCYKLTKDHLYPQHFQKMNVKMGIVVRNFFVNNY